MIRPPFALFALLALPLPVVGQPTPEARPSTTVDLDAEGQPLVTLLVVDETGTPIEQFRVLPGTPYSGIDEKSIAVWQPHLTRESTDGRFEWPQKRTYKSFRLRVEADGYRPAMTAWLDKAAGPQEITVRLQTDTPVEGRVLRPDGQPAAGATLGIALPNRTLRLKGRMFDIAGEQPAETAGARWRQPFTVAADANGHFRLPGETDPSALLVVVHKSGYFQQPFAELIDDDDDQTTDRELRLAAWGWISGQVVWNGHPAADEQVELIVSRETLYPDMVGAFETTRTDAEGRFAFEDVPPGMAQLSRIVPTVDGIGLTQYRFPVVHVEVQPGDPTDAMIGRPGRTVVGRLTGLDSYEGVTLRVHPWAPRPTDAEGWQGLAALRKGPHSEIAFRDAIPVEADGSFRIEGLVPESYQLFVNSGGERLRGYAQLRVEPADDEAADEPQDLGKIRVTREAD